MQKLEFSLYNKKDKINRSSIGNHVKVELQQKDYEERTEYI